MKKKIRVGILFGGRSAEHEVSIQSARSVIEAIDREKFEPIPIAIDKEGVQFVFLQQQLKKIDVVFPLLHGPFGEDGTVQGFLKLLGIPFVGACVLSSSVSMDKVIMKRLFKEAGLPHPQFLSMRSNRCLPFAQVVDSLGLPFFIKPANLGSSVGIHKIQNEAQYEEALIDAFSFDHKLILEEAIMGREIECSVLGNHDPIASLLGEIIPNHEFYNYEAKYIDEKGADFKIPVSLPKSIEQKIQSVAIKAFEAVCCEGMARVDFFLQEDGKILLNEINTIPGFTRISLYPKLWEVSGISYPSLIEKLINLALERHEKQRALKTSYDSVLSG